MAPDSQKPAASVAAEPPPTPWVIPAITAVILIAAFCLYYFVYVAAQREHLANRSFRSLAVLGDQVQTMVSVHGSILEFCADLADAQRHHSHREKQNLRQFLRVHPEDESLPREERDQETRKDYLKYLAPNFELTEVALPKGKLSRPPGRLDVRRRNGRWELVLTAQRHQRADKDYIGTLDLAAVMTPLVRSLPFDDILLVSERGTVVYQSNNAGPRFVTLNHLLQAQPGSATGKAPGTAGAEMPETGDQDSGAPSGTVNSNADQTWRQKPMHTTDVLLAGTRYKVFLQPVLVDVFSDEPGGTEPAREWVLCGLRSAKTLEWEALSISSNFAILCTALFLVICMSGPILKVLFMNRRERLRLRELGFLGIFLVLLTSVFTLTGLEVAGYPLNDDTETQLERLGHRLSVNVHDELQQMREQLKAWCRSDELRDDLKLAGDRDIIRNVPISEPRMGEPPAGERPIGERRAGTGPKAGHTPESSDPAIAKTPDALIYRYANNAFWTDDDGNQIVKWSTSGFLTPIIDVSGLAAYTHAKATYLDGKGPPFHFDSILPPNKVEYLSALTMRTEDCVPESNRVGLREDITHGSAFLTAQPFSLIDPILPFGYGFALLDEKGAVLFHSDKTRNLRENFLQESDWSRQLYAAGFGHAMQRSLTIRYLGKDYRVRAIPVSSVSQAPWSLVVYRDLTAVRTLNLQAMTMAATLLLAILIPPALIVAVWCAARRYRFAPEWLWPNRARMANYVLLVVIYGTLIVLFLFLGFAGTVEQNIVACVLVPYTALLLTVWSFRGYAPNVRKSAARRKETNRFASAMAILAAGGIVAAAAIWERGHLASFTYLFVFATLATTTLRDRPRRTLTVLLRSSLRGGGNTEAGARAWQRWYVLSLALMLFLLGVLMPLSLFRASLTVERRLGVKQAQLRLASALGQRLILTNDLCEKGELSNAVCDEFKNRDSAVWGRIVLDPLFSTDGKLHVSPHSDSGGGELYRDWFQNLVYALHHDYNDAAAETLGVIRDRGAAKPVGVKAAGDFPDWSWENAEKDMTLRWHGVHLPGQDSQEDENDLLIVSSAPGFSWGDLFSGASVAAGVMVAIGCLLWALVRRVFLFHIDPLRMTGERKAIEAIREGANVVVLAPPGSDWRPPTGLHGGQNWTIDLAEVAKGPRWAVDFDLGKAPVYAPIEIHHFEYSSNDMETDNQKFVLVERLLQRENTQPVVIMALPPSPEDPRRSFPSFEVIDLREEPFYWLKQYEGPGRDPIWKECGPLPALWPIGAQLARDIKNDDVHSAETIASEILERAEPYYRLIWKECSSDQKFALAQLAEDGLLNPVNGRAIRQMVRRGLIAQDPQFRIMNESFRRFIRSAASAGLKQEWVRDSRRSGWGKMHGAFVTTLVIVGAFLLTTQNTLWESSAAYVTTALGALGTLGKLFNTFRGGGGITEKAG